jgi:hypothetical protein
LGKLHHQNGILGGKPDHGHAFYDTYIAVGLSTTFQPLKDGDDYYRLRYTKIQFY